ncbi:MAG: Fe-S cluster assembly protein SufD [Gemmatimonadetes bacterium]|nr:Fe-S cluster assembly protein SufD [Gemmatimonadota bacterium]
MTEQRRAVSRYEDQFRRFSNGEAGSMHWLGALRKQAITRFSQVGFPSTHQEDWRFTNVQSIAEGAFAIGTPAPNTLSEAQLNELAGTADHEPRLVFVDGVWSAALSRLSGLPRGVRVESLSHAVLETPEIVSRHLARYAKYQENSFTALSTAFLRDGAFVHFGRDVEWDHPIQIIFAASGSEGLAIYPRCLVVVEERAKAVVQELHTGAAGRYFTNAVTEVVVSSGARLEHCRIQRDAEDAYHVATTQSHQGPDSVLESCSVAFGAGLSRHDVGAVLDGPGAYLTLNGLSVLSGRQHADHHTVIDHAQPHCESHELFNGVFDEQARGVFNGRIVVRPGAQRTDSKQTNNNLLLSKEARADSQPQLEIYADDVKCTHGATLGPLDDTSMFYLRSRGIDVREARKLLTYGFGADIVGRVRSEPIRRDLNRMLVDRLSRLPMGEMPS